MISLRASYLAIVENHSNAQMISLMQMLANYCRQVHDEKKLFKQLTIDSLFIEDNKIIYTQGFIQKQNPLSLQERAENLQGLEIPDDYFRIFKHMYFFDGEVPAEFTHSAKQRVSWINPQDIWLWDAHSAQAMVIHSRARKKKYRSFRAIAGLLFRVLRYIFPVFWAAKKLLKKAYQEKIELQGRIGVALHPAYETEEKALLAAVDNPPVLVRLHCHEGEIQWQKTIDYIDRLFTQGFKITVALLQHRKAVISPETWEAFIAYSFPRLSGKIVACEVGHAVNRVKWGIWHAKEYKTLVNICVRYQVRYPDIKLMGPAVIDFEWFQLINFLGIFKKKLFAALSQHLYVDRRGAPECFQGRYSTLEKCAMARAVAKTMPACDNHVIISEVNWPLKNTGIYSPIGSPYTAPQWFADLPGVSEEDYASYLIRYLTITLCSGFIDQVFIWRLSAHGYGLVDDRDGFRKRPAFFALQHFLKTLGKSTFIQKKASMASVYHFVFKTLTAQIELLWSTAEGKTLTLESSFSNVVDIYGNEIENTSSTLKLTGSPVYGYREVDAFT
jgi:hypothetical protein